MSYQQKLISLLAQSNLQRRKQSLKLQRNYLAIQKDRVISDQMLRNDKGKSIPLHQQLDKSRKQTTQSTPSSEQREYKTLQVKNYQSHRKPKRISKQGDFMDLSEIPRRNRIVSKYERQLRYKTESRIDDRSLESKLSRKQGNIGKIKYKTDRRNILNRLERINQYSLHRLRNHASQKQQIRYKNEKINILTHTVISKKRKQSEDAAEHDKLQADLKLLIAQFQENIFREGQITRQMNQNYQTLKGRLLFFIGYEIIIKNSEKLQNQQQSYQLVLTNYYQIYYSMKLSLNVMILQCYLVLMDFAIEQNNYAHAQKYAQKCLLTSIFYKQKYYEQKSIQKISMCEYYRGNICQATYLHDNNGQVTGDSVRKIRDGYNQQEQMQIIFHHLYETVRFDVRELLADYERNMKGYKAMVVFQSPRIGLDDSMANKQNQLKIDIIRMERMRVFKQGVDIMKKQVKRHESLFSVRRTEKQSNQFKLIKRNMKIDEENQSSQILRAHQSMNRASIVNKKSILRKLLLQFVQFCRDSLNKLH